jgi:hypothetical protein
MSGRAGFVSGAVYAQNLQAGSITKTLGGTGTDTVAVTFPKTFQKKPKVVVSRTSSSVTTNYVSAVTLVGFTLNISSSSLTTVCTYDYVAMDDSYN